MQLNSYPRLAEELYTNTLPNGLRIRIVPKKDFARKYAFLAVDFGSIDTKFSFAGEDHDLPAGIAHYLEHKMFDLPDMDASARFVELGASSNAFTSYSMTAYHFSCTDNFSESLALLLRMVTVPYFTEESVEKERGIIEQEIRMYEDSAESRVYEELFSILFPKHPASVPISGTVESISQITVQMLYDCHKAFYTPANMILSIAGDVDPQEILELAEKYTHPVRVPLPIRDHGDPSGPKEAVFAQRSMPISMPTLAMAFPCPPVSSEEIIKRELVGELASEILAGESSPLYTELYNEGLIDASFSVGYESIKDLCLLSLTGDSDKPEDVYKAVIAEGLRIAKEGLDEEWFHRLLHSSLGRRMRDLDSFSSICYRLCAYEFDGYSYFDFPDAYAKLRPEDVQDFLAQCIRADSSGLSVIYPKEDTYD